MSGKNTVRKARNASLGLLAFVSIFLFGYFVGKNGIAADFSLRNVTISRETPADKNVDFSLFWQVWDSVHELYFDKGHIVDSELVYGAIQGMVGAIGDPYTVFLPPQENQITQEDLSGNFEGVGIQIGFKGAQLAVISPLPLSPAEEAGVRAGDLIIGITDEGKGIDRGTKGISLPEAVQIIRGPAGSKILLTIIREGSDEPIIIEIVRRNIDVPSVILAFVGDNQDIAHVHVLKFGAETKAEWEEAVRGILKNRNLKGIILDLRNNPGGFLQGSIDLGTDFLDLGDVVVVEEHGDGTKEQYVTENMGRLTKEKIVILINGGSASASEILAGALRDNKKVTIIGEKSFGKGTIQEPHQLQGGVGLHITVARWLTPNGIWVNDEGVMPDIEIKDNPDTAEDEQLDRGVEYIYEE